MRGSGFLPVSHAVGFLAEGVLLPLYAIACFLSSGFFLAPGRLFDPSDGLSFPYGQSDVPTAGA
jgi:hypothetical protein